MAIFPVLMLILMVIGASQLLAKSGKIRFGTPKVTHWLLIGYIGVLIVATVVSPLIKENKVTGERLSSTEVDRGWEDYYQKLHAGNLKGIHDRHLVKKERFENFTSDTLEFNFGGDFGPQILVERDRSLVNAIEIYSYREQLVIDGLDFTSKAKGMSYQLNGNKLEVAPTLVNVELAILNNSFPVRQFTREAGNNHTIHGGESILYLKVPEQVKVQTEGQIGITEVEK
ncbi:hypothetical protein D1B31_18900 [Neobacillus notoginsengisoli]|uniref:Uncharacterized protein n=1 Tax=Neobacillus notoginsengisoli TaxID=1578198 RepID=A0A417YPE5_9BACI|nr:hypothetical protein [Neobacillus notoginsengisoli]RHW35711.1 hypothetical protein D1B31_18900 [Neobacillus notoginsengisoli]